MMSWVTGSRERGATMTPSLEGELKGARGAARQMYCHIEPLLRRILTFNGTVVVDETARLLRSTLCVTSFRMAG